MNSSSNKNLRTLARNLRKHGTKGEALLWRDVLKARQMKGYQFNRQFPIGNYIVDFVSRKLKLIIEIDGNSHVAKSEEDYDRQEFLKSLGYRILRFSEAMVILRIDEVATDIEFAIECIEEQGVG
jgi:very-short-patch-repair endonuclease